MKSDEIQTNKERSCETCRYDLGGGYNNCMINLEAECAEGGFEAWEPKEDEMRERSRIKTKWRMKCESTCEAN